MARKTKEESKQIAKEVKAETEAMFREAHQRHGWMAERIARERSYMAFQDPADFVEIDEGGAMKVKTFEEMGEKRRAIKKIKEKTTIKESTDGKIITKYSTVELEFHDKQHALDYGGEIVGERPPQKIEQKHTGSVTVEVVNYGAPVDK